MKIAYCGYDFFYTCLAGLISDGHTLVELFSFPTDNQYDFNDNVFRMAREHKARITLSPMTAADMERLSSLGVEVIVSAAYPYKIPEWRNHVAYALNVHPSPLPEGRGPWPLPWMILKGFSESAVTIHEISPSFDSGDILTQVRFPLTDRETLESLSLRSQLLAEVLVRRVFPDLGNFWAQKKPQGKGSYWRMPKPEDRTITWDMTIDQIDRIVRAFSKFEPFLFLDKVRYFVNKVDVWPDDSGFAPGTLVLESSRERVYAAKDGLVCLSQIERADKKWSSKGAK